MTYTYTYTYQRLATHQTSTKHCQNQAVCGRESLQPQQSVKTMQNELGICMYTRSRYYTPINKVLPHNMWDSDINLEKTEPPNKSINSIHQTCTVCLAS